MHLQLNFINLTKEIINMDFIDRIKNQSYSLSFNEVIDYIESKYNFTPTGFKNGETFNPAGTNSGSCKLLYFAMINDLTKEQTLQCFGDFYQDVKEDINGDGHQNIRNFMKHGWEGIKFDGIALTVK